MPLRPVYVPHELTKVNVELAVVVPRVYPVKQMA